MQDAAGEGGGGGGGEWIGHTRLLAEVPSTSRIL